MSRRHRTAPIRREGFVLLSVIVVLIVVGVILVRMASQGLQMTLAAQVRADQLQKDWAVQSIERAVLPHASRVFEEISSSQTGAQSTRPIQPTRSVIGHVRIGDTRLQLILADEDAKLSLNQLYLHKGLVGADATLKRICPPLAGVTQQLRPAVRSEVMRAAMEKQGDIPRAFRSWGEVYGLSVASLEQRAEFISHASVLVTCWGMPKLNYLRCDKPVLTEVLKLVVDTQQASELADQIHANPRLDLQALMIGNGVDESTRDELTQLLTRVSTCFSLQTEILPVPAKSHAGIGDFTSITILDQPTLNNDVGETTSLPARIFRYHLR